MKKCFIWVMAAVACLGMTACGGAKEKTVSGNEASGNGEGGFAKQSIKVSYAEAPPPTSTAPAPSPSRS